ncbi:MAG: response regulator [Leptospiraceae bacterium]|nr:response regulator [Leptospiraceae bacterium]
MNMKILYVDDEEMNLMVFKFHFGKNYEVILANSGKEGLEVLESEPDIPVVVSDMRMPGMDGLEFIKEAKAKLPSTKYFILTGFDISPEIQDALQKKLIEKYFQKPIDMQKLEEFIIS